MVSLEPVHLPNANSWSKELIPMTFHVGHISLCSWLPNSEALWSWEIRRKRGFAVLCITVQHKGSLKVWKLEPQWHDKHSCMTCPCLFPTTLHQSGWHIWSLLFSYGLLKKRKDGKWVKKKKKNKSGSRYLFKKKIKKKDLLFGKRQVIENLNSFA